MHFFIRFVRNYGQSETGEENMSDFDNELTVNDPLSFALPLGITADAARTSRTRLMLEAPIGPTLAKLAAPNVLAMFVQAAQIIA